MKKATWIWAMAMAGAAMVCVGSGCGKAEKGAVEETGKTLAAVVKTPEEEAKEAVEGAVTALKEGRLDAVYGALPESWQGDLSRVAAAYAGKVDPELAKAASEALAAVGKAVEAQAANLAVLAMKAGEERSWQAMGAVEGMSEEDVAAGLRAAGGALKACGEWLSVEKLAKGDLSGVLGNGALREGLQVLLAETEGDAWPVAMGRIGVRGAEKEEGGEGVSLMVGNDEDGWERVVMRKIEGRWVPGELAEAWRGAMDMALAKSAEFEIPVKEAARAKQLLPTVARMAEGLAGAKSAEELEGQLQGMMMGAVMMMGMPMD